MFINETLKSEGVASLKILVLEAKLDTEQYLQYNIIQEHSLHTEWSEQVIGEEKLSSMFKDPASKADALLAVYPKMIDNAEKFAKKYPYQRFNIPPIDFKVRDFNFNF